MIIMINGAFGVGKTSVSSGLAEQIENSIIFDPEEVGFMLRNIIPEGIRCKDEDTGDFQDLELWRKLIVTVAGDLIDRYNVNLIVPMTIYRKEYFDYIYNGFKELDRDIHHFCLTASFDTIHRRLENRGDVKGSWAYKQTARCIASFEKYDFSEYLDTETCTVDETINIIKEKVSVLWRYSH
jgi:deoxyadenosine/deoxycytidine kinase